MRLLRKIAAVTLLAMMSAGLSAQKPGGQKPPLSERLFYGGSFGLQFGTVTNIELEPAVGVWLLPRIAAGAGPSYQYYRDPYDQTSIYGGKAFIQLMLIQDLNNIIPVGINTGIFAQAEYEGLSLDRAFFTGLPDATGRLYTGTFLAGGGLSQQMGRRSFMNVTFLWAINPSEYSVYGSPEMSISFYF